MEKFSRFRFFIFSILVTIFLGPKNILGNQNQQFDYIEATLGEVKLDYHKDVVIIISGKSGDLGNAPFISAFLRAKAIQSYYGDKVQVVFYRVSEKGKAKDEANTQLGKDSGVVITESNTNALDGSKFISYLDQFTKIKEIHFYGHSSPWYMKTESGLLSSKIALKYDNLDGETNRNNLKDHLIWSVNNIELLKDNFTSDAFITVNGCNAGFYFAIALSEKWNVPVSSAFTGTEFQQLSTNGKWYTDGFAPKGNMWAQSIKDENGKKISCQNNCYRMMPQPSAYKGYWGDLTAGYLPFFKMICHLDENNNSEIGERCLKAMANNLVTIPSGFLLTKKPSYENYLDIVIDTLCPNTDSKNRGISATFDQCKQNLLAYEKAFLNKELKLPINYNPYSGNLLTCSHLGCDFDSFYCKWTKDGEALEKSCLLKLNKTSTKSNIFYEEFELLIKAFDYL